MDEESRFPQASDQSLATKLHNTHSINTSGSTWWRDYAGHVSANFLSDGVHSTWLLAIILLQVQYDTTGFPDKNRDTHGHLPVIFLMKGETGHFIYTVTVNLACCWSAGSTWLDLWTVTLQMLKPLKRSLIVVP